jgi:hypothetical protein
MLYNGMNHNDNQPCAEKGAIGPPVSFINNPLFPFWYNFVLFVDTVFTSSSLNADGFEYPVSKGKRLSAEGKENRT